MVTRPLLATAALLALAACHSPQTAAYRAGWDYAAQAHAQGHQASCSAGAYTLTVQQTGAGTLPDWQDFEHAQGDFLAGCGDAGGARS